MKKTIKVAKASVAPIAKLIGATSPKAKANPDAALIAAHMAKTAKTATPATKAKAKAKTTAKTTAKAKAGKPVAKTAKGKPVASQKKAGKAIVSAKREKREGVKPDTMKGRVYALAQRKNGVALSEIVAKGISINLVAARALIGDLRRMGLNVESIGDGAYKA